MDELLLPLFPLELVLLPEELLPLHIFEDRYKLMIGECLEVSPTAAGKKEFGIVLAKDQQLQSVGCSASIVKITHQYDDGRMDIVTQGTRRFEVLFTNEEKAYLTGGVEFFDDDAGLDLPLEEEAHHAIELFRDMMKRLNQDPADVAPPYRHLSFRIAGPLPLAVEFKQELLSSRNESDRLRAVMRAIEQLIPQLDFVQEARSKAGGNGNMRLGGPR